MMKCSKCNVVLDSRQATNQHFVSSWHALNALRSSKGLPILSNEEFQRLQKQALEGQQEIEEESFYCTACNKSFNSFQSYTNHEKSKKHRANAIRTSTRSQSESDACDRKYCDICKKSFSCKKAFEEHYRNRHPQTEYRKEDSLSYNLEPLSGSKAEDSDLSDWEEISDEENLTDQSHKMCIPFPDLKTELRVKFSGLKFSQPEDSSQIPQEDSIEAVPCILCPRAFYSVNAALRHLQIMHSFSIPYRKYCKVDLLYDCLVDTVLHQNRCIQCEKIFSDYTACQRHLLDKPHLCLTSVQRYKKFYNIRAMERELLPLVSAPQSLSSSVEDGAMCAQLVLPGGGRVLINRSLAHYAKQRLRQPVPAKAAHRRSSLLQSLRSATGGNSLVVQAVEHQQLQKQYRGRNGLKQLSRSNAVATSRIRLQVTGAG